jgi:hypothetical protein
MYEIRSSPTTTSRTSWVMSRVKTSSIMTAISSFPDMACGLPGLFMS